ncbi:redoxin domain-containing protein [Erwinia sp. PsM31]|uniref:redoxin domain-containing protein n=1 Tax=Erwinia sp. PsM31 TaxID=3030535 RepID=UPI00263B41D0|nr:redoxin domain-containing protein [Erwinia sp. PsM31]MDN4627938.1 redoxin domain-containing protein [Erwinia sp. PsM31]
MANIRQGLRTIFSLLLAIAVVLWLMDWLRAPKPPEDFAQQIFHTIDGRTITIAELSAKKPLLIYFWSGNCSVCRYTTRDITNLSNSGYNVLAIVHHAGNDIQIVRLLNGKHLTLPVINDPTGAIAARWQTDVMPTLLIVKKSKVVQSTTGWTSVTGIRLRHWWVNKWY